MNFKSVINERIISSSPVGGGDIGKSYRVVSENGEYFVKRYSAPGMSRNEARGIEAMAASGAVQVPEVISFDEHFLVLKFIVSAPKAGDFQSRLGRELARMHRQTKADYFGFLEDNFIGATPQKNGRKETWLDFLLENRLGYQAELSGDGDILDAWNRLRPRIPELIAGTEEEPCLIHGDLWGGNVISGFDGGPVLIDPAAYYGHREMELGMTQLFGGFTSEFYTAYDEEFPLKYGWRRRQNLYILYHVLNHYNLFGAAYRSHALSLMRGYL